MNYEERKGGKSISYWADHISRFGYAHMISPHHNLGLVQLYDLDIYGYIFVTLFTLYIAFRYLTRVKPKEEEEEEI